MARSDNPLRIYLIPPMKLVAADKGKRVAKKTKKRTRILWTRSGIADLRRHSKAKTPVVKLEKLFKRSGGTIRQKARTLGLSLGHIKRRKKR